MVVPTRPPAPHIAFSISLCCCLLLNVSRYGSWARARSDQSLLFTCKVLLLVMLLLLMFLVVAIDNGDGCLLWV